MSRSLSSYTDPRERQEAIDRRIHAETEGLGYWAAKDALKHLTQPRKAGVPAPRHAD